MEEHQRAAFGARVQKAQTRILLGYRRTCTVIREAKQPKAKESDAYQYLEVWATLAEKGYKTFSNFLTNILIVAESQESEEESGAPPDKEPGLESDAKTREAWKEEKVPLEDKQLMGTLRAAQRGELSLQTLIQAVETVEDVAQKSFAFYQEAILQLPVDEAVRRIKQSFTSLTAFTTAITRPFWKVDPDVVLAYASCFVLPPLAGVVIASLCGLLFTGWGAVLIAGGVCIAGIAAAAYYKYRKYKKAQLLSRLREAQREAARFFERWEGVNDKLGKEDLRTALKYLKKSQESFEQVALKTFPEVIQGRLLAEDCSICRNPLAPAAEEGKQGQRPRTTSNRVTPVGLDVVVSAVCPTHLFHYECISRWKEVRNNCPLCRAVCPPMSEWTLVFTVPLPQEATSSTRQPTQETIAQESAFISS